MKKREEPSEVTEPSYSSFQVSSSETSNPSKPVTRGPKFVFRPFHLTNSLVSPSALLSFQTKARFDLACMTTHKATHSYRMESKTGQNNIFLYHICDSDYLSSCRKANQKAAGRHKKALLKLKERKNPSWLTFIEITFTQDFVLHTHLCSKTHSGRLPFLTEKRAI